CGDRAPAEHTERSAAGDGGGDVEGEALVLEVLLGSGEGAAFEAVAGCVLDRDRPGGVLPGAALGAGRFVSATLTGGGEGVADAVVRGVVHCGSSRCLCWRGEGRSAGCGFSVTSPRSSGRESGSFLGQAPAQAHAPSHLRGGMRAGTTAPAG